jgi:hypothetical protein
LEVDVKGEWQEYALENNVSSVPYVQIYVKKQLIGYVKGCQPESIKNGIETALTFL